MVNRSILSVRSGLFISPPIVIHNMDELRVLGSCFGKQVQDFESCRGEVFRHNLSLRPWISYPNASPLTFQHTLHSLKILGDSIGFDLNLLVGAAITDNQRGD